MKTAATNSMAEQNNYSSSSYLLFTSVL